MAEENNNNEPQPVLERYFGGNIDRNQVDIDLNNFVGIMDENYKLKEELKDLKEDKGLNNPWKAAIDFAKMLDAWRPIPRLFMGVYIMILYQSVNWFMTVSEPNNAQAGLIATVVGAGAAWFNSYVKTKGDGDKN